MPFTQTFLSLLKATTGIKPNNEKIVTKEEYQEDGYVVRETELEDPVAQILSLEAMRSVRVSIRANRIDPRRSRI